MILPSRLTKAAFTACFIARLMEVCLRPENGAFRPRRASFRILFASNRVAWREDLRTLCRPRSLRSAQPRGMKNP